MPMLIVSLTGGIATGKSVVARALKKRGCYIHPADRVAHRLMKPGRQAWQKIVDHFGPMILNPDRTINRSKLADIVFSNRKERLFLNRLIHPLVMEKIKQGVRRLERKGLHKIFVSEAALTIEAGFAGFFDRIIVVTCDRQVQIQRLMERDRISRRQALQKIRSQMPLAEKIKYADYVINTSVSLEKTAARSEEIFRCLMSDYWKKSRQAGGTKRPNVRRGEKLRGAES